MTAGLSVLCYHWATEATVAANRAGQWLSEAALARTHYPHHWWDHKLLLGTDGGATPAVGTEGGATGAGTEGSATGAIGAGGIGSPSGTGPFSRDNKFSDAFWRR